jgi:hypothetical protein
MTRVGARVLLASYVPASRASRIERVRASGSGVRRRRPWISRLGVQSDDVGENVLGPGFAFPR